MKKILILLFLSYACSDKLDLTYLPPPGSQYAGGRPEDIQTPFDFPKQTYSTTQRPIEPDFGQGIINPEDYEATIGINRVPPRLKDGVEISGPNAPFRVNQKTLGVPTTTVSYAFTQTTTHPPAEAFEITISPITGLPVFKDFNIPSQGVGQIYQENHKNKFHHNTPGNIQTVNKFDSHHPLNEQHYHSISSHREPIDQYGYKQPAISKTPGKPEEFSGKPIVPLNPENQINQSQPRRPQIQQDYHHQQNSGELTGFIPETSSGYPYQYSRNKTGIVSSTTTPQITASGYFPGTTYEDNINNSRGFSTVKPDNSPSDFEDLESNSYGPILNQDQYHGSGGQTPQQLANRKEFATTSGQIPQQKYHEEYSDVRGFPQKEPFSTVNFPTGSPFNVYSTDSPKPGFTELNNKGNIATTIYRPQRPQADSDRNAVILNYENVITPDGFAYTFDTSNGIHADESGTAIDGVKAKGSYSYIGDDGKVYSIVYTADENGFQPHGEHLPTAPPIPEAIQKIIEKVEQEKAAGIFDDGTYDESKYGYKKYQDDIGSYPQDFDLKAGNGVDFQTGTEVKIPYQNKLGSKKPSSYYKKDQSQSQNDNELPINQTSYKNNLETSIDYPRKENPNKQHLNKIPARRPTVEVERNQLKHDNILVEQEYPVQGERQFTAIEDTRLRDDTKRKEVIKETSTYPIYPLDDESDEILDTNNGIKYKSNNRDHEPPRQSVADLEKYEEGVSYTGRPENKFSTKRPSNQPFVNNDRYGTTDRNNLHRVTSLQTSSKQPSRIENLDTTQATTSLPPLRSRVGINENPSSKITIVDQTSSKTYRLSRPGVIVNKDETTNDFTDNTYNVDDDSKTYDFEGTKSDYDNSEDEYKISSKIPQIFSTKYAAIQGTSPIPDVFNEGLYNGEQDQIVKNKYGQKVNNKPILNSRTGLVDNIEQKINQSGYQYIPPYTKFDEVSKFPSRVFTTKRPSQQTTYHGNKGSTSNPFVTPDDSHISYRNPEEEYFEKDEVILNDPRLPYQGKPNRVVSVNYNKEKPTVGQTYDDQEYSTKNPYDHVSSTVTTLPQRPTQYQTTQKDTITSGQQSVYSDGSRKPNFNFVSQTTPLPSQGPFDSDYTPGDRKSDQYSTSYRTMEPINPTNDYSAEITASRLPIVVPTKGSGVTVNNLKYGDRLPSTTYRPNYTIVTKEEIPSGRPEVVVDRYGRPIVTSKPQDFNQQYHGSEDKVSFDNENIRPQFGLPKGLNTATGYQSTERIIGEDFSGPKQQQKFDPKTGYYY